MGLIFTYGLCYGGSVISLWRPYYGLLIYITFALIKPELTWYWSVPQGNYSRIIAFALLAGWAINGFGGLHFGKSKWIIAALVCYFLWGCLSAALSPELQIGFEFVEAQFKIILPVIVGATLIKSRQQLMQLAWVITLSVGFLAFNLNQYYFQGNNILASQGYGGMDNNSFAIKLVASVGLAFYLGLGSRKLVAKTIAFGCAALITHAVFFSLSRGGMLSLCVVGLVSFWFLPKRPMNLVLYSVGLLLAFMMAGNEVVDRFASTFVDAEQRDESAESRVVMWKACLTLIQQNPITGVGPDRFNQIGHLYHPYAKGKEAHTLWLTIGAELGIPGLLFLLLFYLGTIFSLSRFLRNVKRAKYLDPFDRLVPQMVITSLVGFMVAAQFVSLERLEIPFYVTLLGLGAMKVYAQETLSLPNHRSLYLVPVESVQAQKTINL